MLSGSVQHVHQESARRSDHARRLMDNTQTGDDQIDWMLSFGGKIQKMRELWEKKKEMGNQTAGRLSGFACKRSSCALFTLRFAGGRKPLPRDRSRWCFILSVLSISSGIFSSGIYCLEKRRAGGLCLVGARREISVDAFALICCILLKAKE